MLEARLLYWWVQVWCFCSRQWVNGNLVMWKKQAPLSSYFGVQPAPKKHHTEPEPRKKRMFSDKWLQEDSWLQRNDAHTEMWRKLCRENATLVDETSTFYTVTKNFNHPANDKHGNSREHQRIVSQMVLTGYVLIVEIWSPLSSRV